MKIRFIAAGAVLVIAAAGVLAFGKYHSEKPPADQEKFIVSLIAEILKKGHYNPKPIDDNFSKEVFGKYLADLDPEKNIFLQTDITNLQKFETSIDDEINTGAPLDFFDSANAVYERRMNEASHYYPVILSHPFNFTKNDSIQLDADKIDYPANEAARQEEWRKLLKYRTLDNFTELLDLQKKAIEDSAHYVVKPDSALQSEAREKVKENMQRFFKRLNTTFDEDARFSEFVNAITTTMDPHTEYFPPVDKRTFDEQMSGTFYGIGALLQEDNGKIKIASIITGGPAWKEGELKQGDIILKVAQGDAEPVDITGYATTDAVKIIRGDKGAEVRLTVKQTDGTIKTISIIRGEVKLDATFAKSYIIHDGNRKIGLINLPEFYSNFNDPGGPTSSKDVANEIAKLKAANVDGIVIDLRFNGGGSLGDAVDIAGLFISQGPVVQVRSGEGRVTVLNDHNSDVAYDGPLAVMVNEYSASASEIFAAAMQDYHRAVIIGSPNTYGKGTVQRMFDLDKSGELGAIKLTTQKFYRINGGSTQIKGVHSDIVLPDNYFSVAEKTDTDALAWDEINPAQYTIWKRPVNIGYLQRNSQQRLDSSKVFHLIDDNIALLKKLEGDKKYSLNIKAYRAQQKQNEEAVKKINDLDKEVTAINISNIPGDLAHINTDSTRASVNRDLLKSYKKDAYLGETINVMEDMINAPAVAPARLSKN